MPRSLRSAVYGPEYEHLLLHASETGQVLLTLPTEQHARALRTKLYVYFAALRRENRRPDLVLKANNVEISQSHAVVRLGWKKDSWDNQAIRSCLGLPDDVPPPPAPPSASEEVLTVMRSKLAALRRDNGN